MVRAICIVQRETGKKGCEELCGESQKLFESEIKGNCVKNFRTHFIKEEHTVNLQEVLQLDSFSNVKKLYRVTAWVLRFINNLKRKVHNEVLNFNRCLNRTEISASELLWLHDNQKNITQSKNYNQLEKKA